LESQRSTTMDTAEPDIFEEFRSSGGEPEWLPVASLHAADSPRQAGEEIAHVQMLARLDVRLPPILVHRQSRRVIDGMHRLLAARLRGDELIEAIWFDGSDQEAFVLAVKANTTHGLPLSLADRSQAAERIITAHPAWSDRSIASAVGLGARTVGNIRRRMQGEDEVEVVSARTGRDGRVRPLDNATGRLRASDVIRARPDASLREIAREAGVSPSTVRDVRQRLQRGEDPVPQGRRRTESRSADDQQRDPARLLLMLQGLQSDPSLRFTESGRTILRWVLSRAIRSEEWVDVAQHVPPHCAYILADVARSCADEWLQMADTLEQRGARPA
jgi:ParB-like chromosome segregation protein Spo0J